MALCERSDDIDHAIHVEGAFLLSKRVNSIFNTPPGVLVRTGFQKIEGLGESRDAVDIEVRSRILKVVFVVRDEFINFVPSLHSVHSEFSRPV